MSKQNVFEGAGNPFRKKCVDICYLVKRA